ncbi:DNA-binding domain-containing protein [Thermophagus sp. OGC60D27]|uniref:DNA-binding domain-containing protein n=1 Tax=Thermophagus sp. OGC60D27 TaxID=3458415 RepID=UPI004037FAAC
MVSSVFHSLKVKLYPNNLSNDSNDFYARVDTEKTLYTRDVCLAAVTRGGADSTPEMMEKNVLAFLKEMGYQLCNGFSISTGYFYASTGIRGRFKSEMDAYDPERHLIYFQFNQGPLLREESKNINVEIVGVADTGCQIVEIVDIKSGSVNDLVTPGCNLRIKGSRLKIAGDLEEVGIRFINADSGEIFAVEPVDIITNMPSEIVILTPKLPGGSYRLELGTQFSGNTSILLKKPKKVTFEGRLTVR